MSDAHSHPSNPQIQPEYLATLQAIFAEGLAHGIQLLLKVLRLRCEELLHPRFPLDQQHLVLLLKLLCDCFGLRKLLADHIGSFPRSLPFGRAHRMVLLFYLPQPVDDHLRAHGTEHHVLDRCNVRCCCDHRRRRPEDAAEGIMVSAGRRQAREPAHLLLLHAPEHVERLIHR
jgi:hypothetical protein